MRILTSGLLSRYRRLYLARLEESISYQFFEVGPSEYRFYTMLMILRWQIRRMPERRRWLSPKSTWDRRARFVFAAPKVERIGR